VQAIAGLQEPKSGSVHLGDQDLGRLAPHRRVRLGLGVVLDERRLFRSQSVETNLRLGCPSRADFDGALRRVHAVFPMLRDHTHRQAALLSGGQQQMLAIGQALMANPAVIVLDEPSSGLAPNLVWEMLGALRRLADDGLGIVLVEQAARQALTVADRAVGLLRGETLRTWDKQQFGDLSDIERFYFGGSDQPSASTGAERRRALGGEV
jgi:branched-chain amino acid transport system ATP-binding protein